jgi:hypothetical protein
MSKYANMDLLEIKARSHPRHNARVSVDLRTICLRVKNSPGQSAYWHYGDSLARSYYYSAFARAVKYGLVENSDGYPSVYFITDRGLQFCAL